MILFLILCSIALFMGALVVQLFAQRGGTQLAGFLRFLCILTSLTAVWLWCAR